MELQTRVKDWKAIGKREMLGLNKGDGRKSRGRAEASLWSERDRGESEGELDEGTQALDRILKMVSHPVTNVCAENCSISCRHSRPKRRTSVTVDENCGGSKITCSLRASNIRCCMSVWWSPELVIFLGTTTKRSSRTSADWRRIGAGANALRKVDRRCPTTGFHASPGSR